MTAVIEPSVPMPMDLIDFATLLLPTGCFDRAERECAAWLIVRLHQLEGATEWREFRLMEFAEMAKAGDEPTVKRLNNPFWNYDFASLIEDGLIVDTTEQGGRLSGRPTAGFAGRMARWARR